MERFCDFSEILRFCYAQLRNFNSSKENKKVVYYKKKIKFQKENFKITFKELDKDFQKSLC